MTEAQQNIRINELEKRLFALEVKEAVGDEQYKTMLLRLDKIDGHISKLVWLAVSGIGAFVIKFIIDGGLAHVAG